MASRADYPRRTDARGVFEEAAKPLLEDLAAAGLPVEGFGHFVSARAAKLVGRPEFDYERSVPILLRWLPRIDDAIVKETIVRSLATRYARPVAARPLVEELKRLRGNALLGWAIGNALEVVADASVFDDVAELAADRSYGKAREMVVVALARTNDPRAVGVLVGLLDDDEVAGHALLALRKLAPTEARDAISRFADHPRTWWRNEARKALAKIDAKTG